MTAYLQPLFEGAITTARITLSSIVLAFLCAFAAGVAGTSRNRGIRGVARAYTQLFRGTSLLVQLFWMFYALPLLGIELTALTTGITTLSLHFGAYGAEIVRGAIRGVPRQQIEAAVALNLSPLYRFRRVILPQAIPAMIPAFGNNAIELLKGSALVSLITIQDLTFRAQTLRNVSYDNGTIFSLVLLMYFAMSLSLTAVFRTVERTVRIPGLGVRS